MVDIVDTLRSLAIDRGYPDCQPISNGSDLIEKQRAVIKALVEALTAIRSLKPEKIGDTGFETGPLALLNAAQRIAKDALKSAKELGDV